MSIYVRDLLDYVEFESAEIIAGASGLNNRIKRINLLGITTEELEKMDDVNLNELVNDGDFYVALGTFFNRKDVDFYKEFEALIDQASSGLCIIGYKANTITDDIKKLCNHEGYPVIIIGGYVSFSDLIDVVMHSLIRSRLDKQVDSIINRILYTNCSNEDVRHYLRELEPSLNENIKVLHVISDDNRNLNTIRERLLSFYKHLKVFHYKDGVIILFHTSSNDQSYLEAEVSKVEAEIRKRRSDVHMGVSCYYESLGLFKHALKESMYASMFAREHKMSIQHFSSLTIDNWLLDMVSNDQLIDYVNNILMPIKNYDKEHDTELLQTLKVFVECEGQYKKIAAIMHIHENSARYRMDKIKDILDMDSKKVSFYTNIKIALHYDKVKGILTKLNEMERKNE